MRRGSDHLGDHLRIPAVSLRSLPHLQLQQTEFIPLALWALHRVVRVPRLANIAALGAFVAGEFLSSVYLGVF